MNDVLALIVLVTVAATWGVCAFCDYMLRRNDHVYLYRKTIIEDDSLTMPERERRLLSLPSYGRMMWQLFTWDWNDRVTEG